MKPSFQSILTTAILASPSFTTCSADYPSSIVPFLDGACSNLTAPFFGATPPEQELELHQRGWSKCNRCGGAERLGAVYSTSTKLSRISTEEVADIIDAVRAHGIVVIQNQNLTRAEQVEFTSRLGAVVVLPSSFQGKDPEPFHPAIQRITKIRRVKRQCNSSHCIIYEWRW